MNVDRSEPVSAADIPGRETARDIGRRLRLLNLINALVVIILLAVVLSSYFEAFDRLMGFSTQEAMIWILVFTGVLAIVAIIFSSLIKKQVVNKITEYGDNLHGLLQVSHEIKDEIYGDILLERLVDAALRLTGSEISSILILQGRELVFKAVKGSSAEALKNTSVAVDHSIAGWIVKNGSPVCIDDVRLDKRFNPGVDEKTGLVTKSLLAIPLKTAGKVRGVIELLNKREGVFTKKDVETVSYLADQAAIALERAQFYEDERNFEIHVTNALHEAIDRLTPQNEGHSNRVARYCHMLARAVGLNDDRARRLHMSALLHDIGFIRIPLDRKSDPAYFARHPGYGYEILSPITFYSDLAPIILSHHERFDGNGYPNGVAGENIPLEGRILAIAEVFDAITNPTSYASPRSFPDALEELRNNAGTQFDPDLVEKFVAAMEEEQIRQEQRAKPKGGSQAG